MKPKKEEEKKERNTSLDLEKNEFIGRYGINAFTRLDPKTDLYEEDNKVWVKHEQFPDN